MIAGSLEIQLLANMARLQKDMDDAKRAVGGAMSSIESSVSAAKSALQGLAAGVSVMSFVGMIRGAVDAADRLNDLSKTTGIAVTQLAGLKLAAKQSGGDLEGIAASINKLSVAMGKEGERFAALGVTAKDPLEAFKQLSDVFVSIQDPQLRAAVGAEALGKSWASAAPLLSEGSKNIAEMVAKGTALAGVTQEMAEQADQFNDRLAELSAASNGAKMKLAGEMLPAMTDITKAITLAYEESGKLQAIWVAIGSLGAFLFTDEFASAASKVKTLREELAALEVQKKMAESRPLMRSSLGDIDGQIEQTRARIAALQAEIDKPAKDAAQRKADAAAAKKDAEDNAEAAAKAARAFIANRDAAKEYADELKKQGDLLLKLSGYTTSYEEDARRLVAMYSSGKIGADAYTGAINELVNSQPGVKQTLSEQAKALADIAKAADEAQKQSLLYYEGLVKDLTTLEKSNLALRDQVEEIGLNAEALNALRIARLDATLAQQEELYTMAQAKDANETELQIMRKRIDLLKEQRGLVALGQDKKVAADAAQDAVDRWKRAAEQIERSITDSLFRGFESGKGFIENLRDTIVNTFKTMVLRPVVQFGVGGLLGLGSAGANASGAMGSVSGVGGMGGSGSGMGALADIKSLYDMAKGGTAWLTDFGGSVTNGLYSMGGSLSKAGFESAGSWLTEATSSLSKHIFEISGGAANLSDAIGMVGDGMGYLNTAMLASKGQWGAAIGSGIGTYFGGPIGSAIGGALGGYLDNAFGGGHEYTTGTGISGTFGNGSFSGRNYQSWQNDGSTGLFGLGASGRSSGTNYSAMDAALQTTLGNAFAAMVAQARGFAQSLGQSTDAITGYTEDIKLALGSDATANQKAIEDMLKGVSDRMAAAALPGLSAFTKAGESAGATLARLAGSLSTVNTWLGLMHQRTLDVSMAGGDAASKLADLFGSLDNLSAASKSFYDTYYTEGERTANSQKAMAQALALVNLVLPDNKAGFKDLAQTLDLTTDYGRQAYATLLRIAPEFAATSDALARLATEASGRMLKLFTMAGNVDYAGLGKALEGANTDTFVATLNKVFADLSDRLKTLVSDIASERSAVGAAAAQINGPKTITYAGLVSDVAAINGRTGLPSDAAVTASSAALAAANAAAAAAQKLVTDKSAALSGAGAAKDSLVAYYAGKNRDLRALGAAYSPSGTGITFDAAASGDNAAYNYNAASNRLNPYSWMTMSGYTESQGGFFGIGSSSTSYSPNVAGMRADPKYSALLATLDNGNAALAAAAQKIVDAQADLASASAALPGAMAAQTSASSAAKKAALDYAASIQAYIVQASKSVPALTKLREETMAYYQAQKDLAGLMANSAATLRAAVATTRAGQLDSTQSLALRQRDFGTAYSMALSTTGAVQASYADKLTAALPELSAALADTAATRADWAVATAGLFAQSESIAALLDANAPKDYQAESLAVLGSIDATLSALDDSTAAVTRAIADGASLTATGLRAVVTQLGGVPSFASGGMHAGGLRMVGENGPELEVTGPSRIYNASQTRSILSGAGGGGGGNTARLEALVERQAQQLEAMRFELRAIATSSGKTARILERVTPDGSSLQTVPAT